MRVRNNNGDRRQPQLGMSRRGRQQQNAKRHGAAGEAVLVVRAEPQEEEAPDDPRELRLELTEPQPGEECCITMEPIAEHVPEWLQERASAAATTTTMNTTTTTTKEPLVEGASPRLTKATLPCGHGFNALAVLYHFARNEMTCPCCRQGLGRRRMALASVPPWAREPMQARLEGTALAEREEQAAADATAVVRLLEAEATRERGLGERRVLSLYAYTSMEAVVPGMVLEVPMGMMTVRDGETTVEFATDAVGALEISRNLRMIPIPVMAFEAVVTMRVGSYGVFALARSMRFAAPAQGGRSPMLVPCLGHEVDEVNMQISTTNGGGFERISLRMPQDTLPMLLLQSVLAEPVLSDTGMGDAGSSIVWNAPRHVGEDEALENALLLRAAAEEARLWDRRRNELYHIMVD